MDTTTTVKKICGVCEGVCCKRGGPAVSQKELALLPINTPYVHIKDDLYRVVGKPCPFLAGDGCSLGENRPLACRIYPFYPTADGLTSNNEAKEAGWLLKTSCPFYTHFDYRDLQEAIKVFEERKEEFKTPLQQLPEGFEFRNIKQ